MGHGPRLQELEAFGGKAFLASRPRDILSGLFPLDRAALFDFAPDCAIISASKLAVCVVKIRNRFRFVTTALILKKGKD